VNGKLLLTPAGVVTEVSRARFAALELMWNVAVMVVELTTTTLLTVIEVP
jgi:hypothetical protein